MITALEALFLPTAKISDSDREAAQAILAELDAHVRMHMSPTGCMLPDTPSVGGAMPLDRGRINGNIWHEVTDALRRGGWIAELQEIKRVSAVMGGGQPIVVGHQVALRPSDEVRDEARHLASCVQRAPGEVR